MANLESFVREVVGGSFGPAEAAIARGLNAVGDDEQSTKSLHTIGGAGVGALVGTVLLPGVGTIVGGLLGKAMGEGTGVKLDWQRADLYFALGTLYGLTERKAEARQAWIKALTYKEDHEPSRLALKQVI